MAGHSKVSLPAGLWLALGVIILPLLTVITLQMHAALNRVPDLAQNRALVAHTFHVIDLAQRVRSDAQDAERAQRGYLLTEEPAYLEDYHARVASASRVLAELRNSTREDPEQQRRMDLLAAALEAWLAERQSVLDRYTEQGLSAAQPLVRSLAHANALRTVDQILDGTIATEYDHLGQRQERAARGEKRVAEMALLSGAIGAGLIVLGVCLTVLAFRRARQAEHERHEEEKRLLQQLARAEAALAQAQKMEALGQLTGGVVHDFNNLLHVINSAIAIVQGRLRTDDAEIKTYLEMAKRNTDRAANTTARLLAFSRQQPLSPETTDINRLVSAMAEMLQHTLGERVELETILGSGLWAVSTDPNQLETAILNLAINARDAMPRGGKLTIETSNAYLDESYTQSHPDASVGQYAMIAVSDTGTGMTPEVAAKAFEPFFTTKETGQGTGLGLSQVYGFIKQSGGHVNVLSEPGQGTAVRMYFPRLPGAAIEQLKPPVMASGAGSGESILVVEDDEDVRTFTAQMLRELGYRVSLAPDATAAMKALEQQSGVDLLFTDLGLPGGMSGRALAEEALRRWPRLKVLYTTGYARNAITLHGRPEPHAEVLTKPFTQSSLGKHVRQMLGGGEHRVSSGAQRYLRDR